MKWFAAFAAVVVLLVSGTYWYLTANSATARAEVAAREFMSHAAAGEQGALEAMLAPEARQLAPQIVAEYRGQPAGSFNGYEALANKTGVDVIVLVGLEKPDGMVGTLLLAMREEGQGWVVSQVGKDITY